MLDDGDRISLARRGWISDTIRGALVAADGTIDWYCPDGFDGPATLYRLLDPRVGPAVRIGPAGAPRSRRRAWPSVQHYEPGTQVLRSLLFGRESTVEITDFLPWRGGGETPPGRIVRIVTALRGPASVDVEVVTGDRWRPAARVATWSEGMAFGAVAIRTRHPFEPLAIDRDRSLWRCRLTLDAGERVVVTVDEVGHDRHGPLSVDAAMRLLGETTWAWQGWVAGLAYDGPYHPAVERAALNIKSLTAPGTGAPVAAATASLPRVPGSERLADGRFVSLADAGTAAVVLRAAGLAEDAEAAEVWLRSALLDAEAPLPSWASSAGGPPPPAEELALPGWRQSEPVTVGVGARGVNIDLYADVLAAVGPGRPLSGVWPSLVTTTDWLADHWAEDETGLWQLPPPGGQLVGSRIQAWWALDTMVRLARHRNPLDLDAVGWQQAGAAVRRWLENEAVTPTGSLRREAAGAGADGPDASLLRVAWRGPWPPTAPPVFLTVEATLAQLSDGPFVRRYRTEVDDGHPGADLPDLRASLWAVRALAAVGRWEEAHSRMEAVCGLNQPLGLLGETVDPRGPEVFGNLPSTGVHLALIDAALALGPGPS